MRNIQKYGGTWEFFDSEKTFQGELHIDSDKNFIVLELIIPASDSNPMPRPPYKGKIPYICGTLFSGAKVLLYKCETGKEHTYLLSYTQQIIYSDFAFWGLEIKSEDEVMFSNVTVDFGEIINWSRLCKYNWDYSSNYGVNLIWEHEDPVNFKFGDGLLIKFYPVQGSMESNSYSKEIIARQSILVDFVYNQPKEIDEILDDILSIQYLIGLGIDNEVVIENIKYQHPTIYSEFENKDGSVTKHFLKADLLFGKGEKKSTASIRPFKFIFTLRDINDQNIFLNWNNRYSKLKPVLDLYFTVFSNKITAPEVLFLNLVQALETFHARFITDDVKDYITRVEKITYNYCRGNENQNQWHDFLLDEHQQNSKKIHLRSRLADLIFAEGILPFWPSSYNKVEYISKVVDTRNYYTHYNIEKEEKALSREELPLVNAELRILLQFHILKILGFSTDELRKKTVEEMNRLNDIKFLQEGTHEIKERL